MEKAVFSCDLNNSKAVPFLHFWEHTIGSGHATLALRADWQQQLTKCKLELGFKYVRFHGILSDDMGTMINQDDQFVYSFFNADQICDFLLSIGMRPFIEFSFMPLAISSGKETVFHYKGNITPPQKYADWGNLISKLVTHWNQRYGTTELKHWFFAIWNEPNLKAFWSGSQAEYFRLYKTSVLAIKKINAQFKVGGPATAKNAWIKPFLGYCKKNKLPVDFISTHHYPTDAFGKPGDDTATQLSKSKRSILRQDVIKVKAEAGKLPVYYTEWNTSSNPFDELHDHSYAAAYIIKTIMEARGHVHGYSYWTFSDIFEENYLSSIPFHGGFGLLNIYGVPKPAYRAFQLLHNLGNEIYRVKGNHPTVDVWVIRKMATIQVLITNSILPGHSQNTAFIEVDLKLDQKVSASFIERIDDYHSNASMAWIQMGRPGSLIPSQVASLESASALVKKAFKVSVNEGTVALEIDVPPQGIVCISLETEDQEEKIII